MDPSSREEQATTSGGSRLPRQRRRQREQAWEVAEQNVQDAVEVAAGAAPFGLIKAEPDGAEPARLPSREPR